MMHVTQPGPAGSVPTCQCHVSNTHVTLVEKFYIFAILSVSPTIEQRCRDPRSSSLWSLLFTAFRLFSSTPDWLRASVPQLRVCRLPSLSVFHHNDARIYHFYHPCVIRRLHTTHLLCKHPFLTTPSASPKLCRCATAFTDTPHCHPSAWSSSES